MLDCFAEFQKFLLVNFLYSNASLHLYILHNFNHPRLTNYFSRSPKMISSPSLLLFPRSLRFLHLPPPRPLHLSPPSLSTRLGLPPSTLSSLDRLAASSGDQIRFVRAAPQPPDDRKTALGEHTDFGGITVLFNRLGGPHVRLPDGMRPRPRGGNGEDGEDVVSGWAYVLPLPGHTIVNLGDALVKFSAGC